ncbi:DNA polymerase alpha catalytic subunit, partial [Apophysomyces ossiformis]
MSDKHGISTDDMVAMTDVEDEFADMMERCNIHNFKWRRRKRRYIFDDADIPREAEYLKGLLQDNNQRLEPTLFKKLDGVTFSHVFGTNISPLEQFIIKRRIMGPCWLEIKEVKMNKIQETWCKLEYQVENPKACNPMRDRDGNMITKGPPLVIMSLRLKTVANVQKNTNEIVAASVIVMNQVHVDGASETEQEPETSFTVVRPWGKEFYPDDFDLFVGREDHVNHFQIVPQRNENALLNYLIARIHLCDPDIIVGHNFTDFDLDILLHRLKEHNVPHWHKVGRIKFKDWPKLQSGPGGMQNTSSQEKRALAGRIICDTYLASRDLVRAKSYQLADLARSELGILHEDVKLANVPQIYENSKSLVEFLNRLAFEAFLAMSIMNKLQILPLTKELTNLAGNLWSRSMNGSRSDRNEFLLLHSFHEGKFILPDKEYRMDSQPAILKTSNTGDQDSESDTSRKIVTEAQSSTTYSGGLVLEPKRGLYGEYVLLLDFNSLYPSIIQEFNICFTTVNYCEQENNENENSVPLVPGKSVPTGVLPKLVKMFVDQRRKVKQRLLDPSLSNTERLQCEIKQQALKLTANSMYGCLGAAHSRFYAKSLAKLITSEGRRILQDTVDLAQDLGLNVIYGDTDSVMVFTQSGSLQQARLVAQQLQNEVNKRYTLLEIGVDAIFKRMLLLQKKKYAALAVKEKGNGELIETIETKGLDLVRRDWCDLSRDVSLDILKIILSERSAEGIVEEVHKILRTIAQQVRSNAIDLEKFVIIKQLTKNVNEYGNSRGHPHVEVAKRMRQTGAGVKAGDTIPYIICREKTDTLGKYRMSVAERAYSPDYVKSGARKIDLEWYLAHQVHPPVVRLCAPISETDVVQLAECLDTVNYQIKQPSATSKFSLNAPSLKMDTASRYHTVEKFAIQ